MTLDPRNRDWTAERTAKLKELYLQGLSARQVADQLGGTTRNAVIGKAHRLGLIRPERTAESRRLSNIQQVKTRVRREPKPDATPVLKVGANRHVYTSNKSAKMPKLREAGVEPKNVTLLDRSDHGCKYPSGHDGEQHLFCDLSRAEEGPYCPAHAALCFTGAPPKKRADPAQLNTNGMAFDFRTRAA